MSGDVVEPVTCPELLPLSGTDCESHFWKTDLRLETPSEWCYQQILNTCSQNYVRYPNVLGEDYIVVCVRDGDSCTSTADPDVAIYCPSKEMQAAKKNCVAGR